MRPDNNSITRRRLMALLGVTGVAALQGGCGRDGGAGAGAADLHYDTLLSVAQRIKSGELSPVALTESILQRIESLESRLNAYATVMYQSARSAARRAEEQIGAGSYLGPLHGIPIAVKDLVYTAGTPTMAGLKLRESFVPAYDATVVRRLEGAGAVVVGKLNLTEGALAGYHPEFEIPVNPWGEGLWSGASSSGSGVAAAAGLCYGALGTDTGGSIRLPAMANGIVGLKPTFGRVSVHGVFPLAPSLDHVGPMTRSVGDAAAMFEVMAGPDPRDPSALNAPVPEMLGALGEGIQGLRIGYDPVYASDGVDPALVRSIEAALEVLSDLGAQVVEVTVPQGSADLPGAWYTIASREALAEHRDTFPSQIAGYGPHFRDFLQTGAAVSDEELESAQAFRRDYSERLRALLARVDALVCPAGGVAFPIPQDVLYAGADAFNPYMGNVQLRFTIPADFAGTPSLTVPCGFSDAGVPHTLQFMGASLSEARLCRIGHAYEQATPWHKRHPELI